MDTIRKYPILDTLSNNKKGRVYVASNECGETVVIKTFSKSFDQYFIFDESCLSVIPRELFVMKLVETRDITPRLLGQYETETHFMVVMEHLSGDWMDIFEFSSIYKHRQYLTKVFKDTIEKIIFLARFGIFLLDIKPENILINRKSLQIRLIDFEDIHYEKDSANPLIDKLAGTIQYMGPEVLLGKPYRILPNQVFAMGCVIYNCFQRETIIKTFDETVNGVDFDSLKCGKSLLDLVKSCLAKEPQNRILMTDLLSHNVLNQQNF